MTTAADSVLVWGRHAALSRRWLEVFAAAMFINTSYGTLSYAFSVLVTDSGPGGDFGAGPVSLGFGLALLVSGVTAIFSGTMADLLGTRRLMAGGALVGITSTGITHLTLVNQPRGRLTLFA